jgi:hypothetical protein
VNALLSNPPNINTPEDCFLIFKTVAFDIFGGFKNLPEEPQFFLHRKLMGGRYREAMLGGAGHAKATFNGKEATLVQSARHYTLYLNAQILQYSDESIEKILIHEAVHIGWQNHGKEFQKVCGHFGGVKHHEYVPENMIGSYYLTGSVGFGRFGRSKPYKKIAGPFATVQEGVDYAKANEVNLRKHFARMRVEFFQKGT